MGRLYDAAGAGSPELPGPAVVFWRAMLASASKMEEPLGAAGPAGTGGLSWRAASIPGGGLPGGVVEASARKGRVSQELGHCQRICQARDRPVQYVLGGGGALNFSLKDSSIAGGKVWPLSQMSSSFLIFSCTMRWVVSYWSWTCMNEWMSE